jgi:hypothetical protein
MNCDIVLLIACICSGIVTSNNLFVDRWEDVRFSLNDVYRIGLLIGSMFAITGILTIHLGRILIGLFLCIFCFALLRSQVLIDENQYLRSMIPHQSAAIMMSKHLEQKPNSISHLVDQTIQSHQKSIIFMKGYVQAPL